MLLRILDILGHSPLLQALTSAIPLIITIAGLASWRARVPDTLPLVLWGGLLCLWMFTPVPLVDPQVISFRNYVSILGWLWLVRSWGRFVLSERPDPMWAHGTVGTLLLLLPLTGAVVLIRAL